jgi:ATP citrate (pro-S)-lyase
MSAKGIREYEGKILLAHWLPKAPSPNSSAKFSVSTAKVAQVKMDHMVKTQSNEQAYKAELEAKFLEAERAAPWILNSKLVAKPDQLIKRRGKSGLLLLNTTWDEAKKWIANLCGNSIKVKDLDYTLELKQTVTCGLCRLDLLKVSFLAL